MGRDKAQTHCEMEGAYRKKWSLVVYRSIMKLVVDKAGVYSSQTSNIKTAIESIALSPSLIVATRCCLDLIHSILATYLGNSGQFQLFLKQVFQVSGTQ